jgi:hypothetical protein
VNFQKSASFTGIYVEHPLAPLAAILVCDPERLKFNQGGVWSIYFWIVARIFFLSAGVL